MPQGYWIARFDAGDMEQYRKCVAANAVALVEYGACLLVRGGACQATEGEGRERNVVVEFPSYAAGIACYQSPAYQDAIALRRQAASGELLVIEGHDGPQLEGMQA